MHRIALAIAAILGIFIIAPASAQVVITQAKALAGGITPGDTAGYPITLSQPGAYRLESNLSVPANLVGIAANNNNIDIDFNGFTISGNGVGGWGIAGPYGESRLHNGVVNGFKNAGIYVRGNGWTIEHMKIVRNGGSGIDASITRYIEVSNSLITSNRGYGVISGDNGHFQGNTISENSNRGIGCKISCLAEGNIIHKNLIGIEFGSGLVTDNSISGHPSWGIVDAFPPGDMGYSNNMFTSNNPNGAAQIFGAVPVHPNYCFGKPCTAP